MKFRFVIKDVQYMRALVEAIARADHSLYIEIGTDFQVHDDTMIITDFSQESVKSMLTRKRSAGIIYLTATTGFCELEVPEQGPYTVFKYARVNDLVARIRLIYYIWSGERAVSGIDSKLIAVAADCNAEVCSHFSRLVARQFMFRGGGDVLILPFSFVDMSEIPRTDSHDAFRKLMYYIQVDRKFPTEVFTRKDSFGISYITCAGGINEIARLGKEDLDKLVHYFSIGNFSLVILDIGIQFSEKNLSLIRRAAHRFWLNGTDREAEMRLADDVFAELEYKSIDLRSDSEKLPLIADDFVGRLLSAGVKYERDSA